MRAYQEQDFDRMAQRVVDRFMGGEKLADVAALEAQEGQLNPDQIARMVHAANTMAFLRLMEQQKQQGVPDMTGEFDPIDPRQVIQHIVGGVQLPHECAEGEMPHAEPDGDEGPLPNEIGEGEAMMAKNPAGTPKGDGSDQEVHVHGDDSEVHVHDDDGIDGDNDGPFPKGEKQKAKEKSEAKPKKEPPEKPKKDEVKEAAFRGDRMRKFAAVLEDQFKQAEWAFEDEFGKLEGALARAHGAPAWDVFEKDAMSLTGGTDPGLAVLHLVRTARKLPPFGLDDYRSKIAAMADRHIVDDNDATRSFERLVRIATAASRLRAGAEHVRSMCG